MKFTIHWIDHEVGPIQLANFMRMVSALHAQLGLDHDAHEWTTHDYHLETPTQLNFFDCGPHVIWNVYCMSTGRPLSALPQSSNAFRHRLARWCLTGKFCLWNRRWGGVGGGGAPAGWFLYNLFRSSLLHCTYTAKKYKVNLKICVFCFCSHMKNFGVGSLDWVRFKQTMENWSKKISVGNKKGIVITSKHGKDKDEVVDQRLGYNLWERPAGEDCWSCLW